MRVPHSFYNLRDLSGWECEKGKTIKPGMIYRGPVLHCQNQEDENYLTSLNLDYIFDFRCENETKEKQDYVFNNAKYINCPVYKKDAYRFLLVTKGTRLMCAFLRGKYIKKNLLDAKFKCYEEMPFSYAFSYIFKAMDEGKKFIFHCSEGKDRTGIMSALILYVLGASHETIMEDYMASNKFRPEKNRQVYKKFGFPQELIDTIKYCESVHEDLLLASKNKIISIFDTMENYLFKCYDIDEERIIKWRNLYLTDIK